METNGDLRKYFDDLNKRLDAKFNAIDKRFDAVDNRLEGIDERLDSLTVLVGDLKIKIEGLDQLTTDMQKVQQLLVKQFKRLNERVEKIEKILPRIIALIMNLGEKMSRFDAGKQFELHEVRYDEVSHTLTGIVREQQIPYGRKRRAKTPKR